MKSHTQWIQSPSVDGCEEQAEVSKKKLLLHLLWEDEINNRVESSQNSHKLSFFLVGGSWLFDYYRIVVQDCSDMWIGGACLPACLSMTYEIRTMNSGQEMGWQNMIFAQ